MIVVVDLQNSLIYVDFDRRSPVKMPPSPKPGALIIRWEDGEGRYESAAKVSGRADIEWFDDISIIQPFLDAHATAEKQS
jgi:hypothetical protein